MSFVRVALETLVVYATHRIQHAEKNIFSTAVTVVADCDWNGARRILPLHFLSCSNILLGLRCHCGRTRKLFYEVVHYRNEADRIFHENEADEPHSLASLVLAKRERYCRHFHGCRRRVIVALNCIFINVIASSVRRLNFP